MPFEGHEAIQTINDDGTIKLKIIDSTAYFNDVAFEISKTYRNYSDVKIVCGDGSKFNANKSILSRHRSFSQYLPSNDQCGETTCLIFPDIDSEQMEKALQWFYDVSSCQISDGVNQPLSFLNEVFGGPTCSQVLTNTNSGSTKNTLENGEQRWEIFFQRDFFSRYLICPLCEGKFRNAEEIQRHLSVHSLFAYQPQVLNSKEKIISSNSLPGSVETTSKSLSEDNIVKLSLKYQCFVCEKGFEFRSSFVRHLGWMHFRNEVLSLTPRLCKKQSCPSSTIPPLRRVYHLSQNHDALKYCLTKDQYQSLIAREEQSTINQQRKAPVDKNIPNPKILSHERGNAGEDGERVEIQGSVENYLLGKADVNFLHPFAINTREIDVFFDKAQKIKVSTENLEEWSPGKRMYAKSGYVFIFRGTFESFSSVNQSDDLMWMNASFKSEKRKKIVQLIAKPDRLKMTEAQCSFVYPLKRLDKRKIQFRKEVVFLERGSIYIIHYSGNDAQLPWRRNEAHLSKVSHAQVRSFEETKQESEFLRPNMLFREALPDKDRLRSIFPLKPYLQKQFSIERLFLEQMIVKVATNNVELQTWSENKFMNPNYGNLYVFFGNEQQFEQVQSADNLVWSTVGKHREDVTCKRADLVANPDETRLTTFQRSLLHKYKSRPCLKKMVSFFHKICVFVVFYHGNYFKMPIEKKDKKNRLAFTRNESKSNDMETSLAGRNRISVESDAPRIMQTIATKDEDNDVRPTNLRPGGQCSKLLSDDQQKITAGKNPKRREKGGALNYFAQSESAELRNVSFGKNTGESDGSSYPAKRKTPESDDDPEKSECILKPLSSTKFPLDPEVIKRLERIDRHRTSMLQCWNPKMKINAKQGDMYVFQGLQRDFETIVRADECSWTKKGCLSDESRGSKTCYYIQKKSRHQSIERLKSQPPLRKNVCFLRNSLIYMVHYSGCKMRSKNQVSMSRVINHQARDEIQNENGVEALSKSGIVLQPHLTNQDILGLDFLQKVNNLDESEKMKLSVWTSDMTMDVNSGNVYLFCGDEKHFEQVVDGDCYEWDKFVKSQSEESTKAVFTAKPDEARLSERQLKLLLSSTFDRKGRINFRKWIIFYAKTSLYVVFYYGNQNQMPWVKHAKENHAGPKMGTNTEDLNGQEENCEFQNSDHEDMDVEILVSDTGYKNPQKWSRKE